MAKGNKKIKKKLKQLADKEAELDAFISGYKGAASEKEAERIHSLVNDSITLKIGSALFRAKALAAKGKLEDCGYEIDKDDITMAIRWCVHNKTEPRKDAGEVVREQADELAAIRERNRTRNLKAVGE